MREQAIAHKVGNRSGMSGGRRSGVSAAQKPSRRDSEGSRLRTMLGYVPTALKVGLAVVMGVLIFVGYRAAASASFFQVRRVEVQGTNRVAKEDVQLIVRREAEQAGVWNADLGAISEKLERLPWIKTAVVSRVLPDGLRVRVTERFPRAVVRTASGRFRWIDEEAVMLGEMMPSDQIPAFFLRGLNEENSHTAHQENRERVEKFMELQKAWDAAGLSERVSEVNLIDVRDVRAQLAGDNSQIEVRLGAQDQGERLKKALEVLDVQRQTPRGQMISYIDMSQGRRAIVGLVSGAHTSADPAESAPAPPVEPETAEAATPAVARARATEKPAPVDNRAKRERDKKEAEKKAERTRTTARRRE
ncbi:MAG TPA: FtsQ-type POTRA domain-containing protein [Pyrinomonadaceae bacterium]|nr:FtsQ-type POTRA domain-containing protein [Pyrinomonadaceae bacterium]